MDKKKFIITNDYLGPSPQSTMPATMFVMLIYSTPLNRSSPATTKITWATIFRMSVPICPLFVSQVQLWIPGSNVFWMFKRETFLLYSLHGPIKLENWIQCRCPWRRWSYDAFSCLMWPYKDVIGKSYFFFHMAFVSINLLKLHSNTSISFKVSSMYIIHCTSPMHILKKCEKTSKTPLTHSNV